MSEWQPIETAPKGFTDVLVFARGHILIGHQNNYGDWVCHDRSEDPTTHIYLDTAEEAGITHWMPLPEPPQ